MPKYNYKFPENITQLDNHMHNLIINYNYSLIITINTKTIMTMIWKCQYDINKIKNLNIAFELLIC